MRILGARIFSKSFGGKIKIFNKGWHTHGKNNWRMRILGARIFSKFFGGKIKNFDKGCPKSKFRQSTIFRKHLINRRNWFCTKLTRRNTLGITRQKLSCDTFYKFWFPQNVLKSLLVERFWTNKTIYSEIGPSKKAKSCDSKHEG